MLTISDYRLSFVFIETILDPLTGKLAPASARRPAVVSRGPYQERFDAANADPAHHADLAPPWPAQAKDNFWRWYLEGNPTLQSVRGGTAYSSVIPLRLQDPLKLGYGAEKVRVGCEALVHPWGSALIVTLTCTRELTDLPALAAGVVAARREKLFLLDAGPLTLDEVATAGLDATADSVLEPGRRGRRRRLPFSVLTVVRVSGDPDARDPHTNETLHRVLQACTSFSKTWEKDALDPVASVASLSSQPDSHVVLGARRARTVWGPEADGPHTLSCRHRNLVMAAAQIEAIGGFASATLAEVGTDMGFEHRYLANRAMVELGRLALGHSFRSGSVTAQIKAEPALADINALRAVFQLNPSL